MEVTWDRDSPQPKWGSALVLRDISNLTIEGFRGEAARGEGSAPIIVEENVTRREAATK